ncbi:MAG: hypothetical protein AB7F22_15465 [Reyranella sp.]|uniref:hypothetical protein n=1 Tax=Reyranella sp. TaxID=1929291 RepID=UPI003D0A55ED
MLSVVEEPRRIERAVKRLNSTLKGVPARGVRLTWRGGELTTTIRWMRDEGFWWALEARTARNGTANRYALLLGHAPDAPARRESVTCEINLPRAGADRRLAGLIASDDAGALYLVHSGRMGGTRQGRRKADFRSFLGDGVWCPLAWPDGRETEALVVAPLDSPRFARLLGQFVNSVRAFKAGQALAPRTGLCVPPALLDSARAACDRRLVNGALHEELAKRGLFGGAADLFTLRGELPRPLFALVADGRPDELALAVGSLSLAAAGGDRRLRPILIAPAALINSHDVALQALPFACVGYRWRGARAVFDNLDAALA